MGSRSLCLGSAVLWPLCDTVILLGGLAIGGTCEGREGEILSGEPPPAGSVVPGPRLRGLGVGDKRYLSFLLCPVSPWVPVCLHSNSLPQ